MTLFCDVADIEALLQVTVNAATLVSAQRAITEATVMIQNYCRQALGQVADEVVTFDRLLSDYRLFLPETPVTGVDEVVEDGETLVVEDDYKLGEDGVLYRIGANWPVGVQIVTVTYTHGYATIPDDITAVATRAATRAYQAGLRAAALGGVPGVTSTSLGDYSVAYGAEGDGVLGASGAPMLLPSEKGALARYRIKRP